MKKKIDSLGRLVIPEPYRTELGIELEQNVEIEKIGNKIVISNPKGIRSKDEIEKMLHDAKNLNQDEYNKGFIDALKMVLNKD